MERASTRLLTQWRPRPVVAALLVLATVGIATALVYPLKHAAPVLSLGVIYLLGVLLVSTYVGFVWPWAAGDDALTTTAATTRLASATATKSFMFVTSCVTARPSRSGGETPRSQRLGGRA